MYARKIDDWSEIGLVIFIDQEDGFICVSQCSRILGTSRGRVRDTSRNILFVTELLVNVLIWCDVSIRSKSGDVQPNQSSEDEESSDGTAEEKPKRGTRARGGSRSRR